MHFVGILIFSLLLLLVEAEDEQWKYKKCHLQSATCFLQDAKKREEQRVRRVSFLPRVGKPLGSVIPQIIDFVWTFGQYYYFRYVNSFLTITQRTWNCGASGLVHPAPQIKKSRFDFITNVPVGL
jgi:hypothetical protein